jgi:hypothetical protein
MTNLTLDSGECVGWYLDGQRILAVSGLECDFRDMSQAAYSSLALSPDYLLMECGYCKAACIKAGKQPCGRQKYRCKGCGKYEQAAYKYQACLPTTDHLGSALNSEL